MPSSHGFHDLRGDLQSRVDVTVDRFRRGAFANPQGPAVAGGQHHGDHLVGAELLAQRPPGGVHARVQEPFLDGHQQMVSQDAEEDMGLGATFEVMENGRSPADSSSLGRPLPRASARCRRTRSRRRSGPGDRSSARSRRQVWRRPLSSRGLLATSAPSAQRRSPCASSGPRADTSLSSPIAW